MKPAATQDPGITNCTKHSTQDTTSKTLETAGVVQDTEPENMANPSLLRTNVLMSDNSKQTALTIAASSTFDQLQEAIQLNFSVPPEHQRLHCGFPPRGLHPPSDSSQPLHLTNGD